MVKLGLTAGRPSAAKKPALLQELAGQGKTVRVNFELEEAEHIKLKIHAAKQGRTISDLLREFVSGLPK